MANDIDTQGLMLQMRALAAEAASKPPPIGKVETGVEKTQTFANFLTNSINSVAAEQTKSREMRTAFEKGKDIALTDVMLQAQQASLSFQAMSQVRNKLVEAYKSIRNMPI